MMSIELLGLCILCLDNQEMHANSRSSRTQNGMKQQGSAEFYPPKALINRQPPKAHSGNLRVARKTPRQVFWNIRYENGGGGYCVVACNSTRRAIAGDIAFGDLSPNILTHLASEVTVKRFAATSEV